MRLKRIIVSADSILRIFHNGALTKTLDGVPDGARCVQTAIDHVSGDIILFVEHESYDDVPPHAVPDAKTIRLKDVRQVYEHVERKSK